MPKVRNRNHARLSDDKTSRLGEYGMHALNHLQRFQNGRRPAHRREAVIPGDDDHWNPSSGQLRELPERHDDRGIGRTGTVEQVARVDDQVGLEFPDPSAALFEGAVSVLFPYVQAAGRVRPFELRESQVGIRKMGDSHAAIGAISMPLPFPGKRGGIRRRMVRTVTSRYVG
jgi:hypothetical protein